MPIANIDTCPPPLAQLDSLRLNRCATKLHWLGPRVLSEFLSEVGRHHAITSALLARAERWTTALTLEMVHTAGADRFAAPQLRLVP